MKACVLSGFLRCESLKERSVKHDLCRGCFVAAKLVAAKLVTAKLVTAKLITAKLITAKLVTAKLIGL